MAAAAGIIPLLVGVNPSLNAPLAGWFLVNFYFFLGTSVPNRRTTKGKESQTDGYRLWNLGRMTEEEIRKKCVQARLQIELKTEKDKIVRLSLEEAIARYETSPDSIATLLHLIDKLGQAKDSRQIEYINRLISHPEVVPANFTQFLDTYLTETSYGRHHRP